MANRQREKGNRFELELAKFFASELGVAVFRSLYDGDPMVRKGKGNSDLIGVPQLAVEAKRVESLSFPAAMKQAKTNASGKEVPVVINRRNRQKLEESYVLMELGDFVKYFRAWCVQEGYAKPKQEAEKSDIDQAGAGYQHDWL